MSYRQIAPHPALSGYIDAYFTGQYFAIVSPARTNLRAGFIENRPEERPSGIEIAFTTDNIAQTFDCAVKAGASAEKKTSA